MRARIVLTSVGAVCGLMLGCGYTGAGMFPRDVETVYVRFFDNRTFRRQLEVDLTRAVLNELKLRTGLAFAPADEADSVLSGELIEFEERTQVKSEDDRILVERVRIKVRFQWRDRRTGALIVPAQDVVEFARISADEPVAELAVRKVAQRIVEQMEGSW